MHPPSRTKKISVVLWNYSRLYILVKMKQKLAIFFVLLLSGLHLSAQQKLEGVIDDYGRLIPKSRDVAVMKLEDGLAPFMINGQNPAYYRSNRVGFVDTGLNVVIEPRFINCSYFNDGYALVQDTSFRYGLINKKGEIIIPVIYQLIVKCDNGSYALFQDNYKTNGRKMTLINGTGKAITSWGKYDFLAYDSSTLNTETSCLTGWNFKWTLLNYINHVPFKKLIGVEAGKRWVIIDTTGKEVVRTRFNWMGVFNTNYAPARVGKKWGVTDTAGHLVIPARYNNISIIGGGFVLAYRKNKAGLLSIKNKLLIPFKYDKIENIGDKVFRTTKMGMLGVIDAQNRIIVPLGNYSYIDRFGNGYITTDMYRNKTLLDVNGKRIAWCDGNTYAPFPAFNLGAGNGFWVYNKNNEEFHYYKKLEYNLFSGDYPYNPAIVYYHDNKCGFLNTNGIEVTGAVFDEIVILPYGTIVRKGTKYALFSTQLTALTPVIYDEIKINYTYNKYKRIEANSPYNHHYEVISGEAYYITARVNKGWGILNHSGKPLTAFKFDAQPMFKSKSDLYVFKANGRKGLLNIDGDEVLHNIYDTIARDANRRRSTKYILKKDGRFGMADADGKIIREVSYDVLQRVDQSFDVDTWFAVIKQGKAGLLDSAGRISIPCIYQQIEYYSKTRETCLLVAKSNKHYGIIDLAGQIAKSFIYDSISVTRNRGYDVVLNKKHGLLDAGLTQIIPPVYDDVQQIEGMYIVLQNKKYGMVNDSGAIVAKPMYDGIEYVTSKYFKVKKDSKIGVINRTGKIMYPCAYTDIVFGNNGEVEKVVK